MGFFTHQIQTFFRRVEVASFQMHNGHLEMNPIELCLALGSFSGFLPSLQGALAREGFEV